MFRRQLTRWSTCPIRDALTWTGRGTGIVRVRPLPLCVGESVVAGAPWAASSSEAFAHQQLGVNTGHLRANHPSSRKVGVAHGLNLGKLLVMQTRAVWALRALWFLLPLTVGQAASDAVASAEHAVPFVMTAGLWVLWAAGMVASMVPLPGTLVAIRILAVGTLPLAAWALVELSTVDKHG